MTYLLFALAVLAVIVAFDFWLVFYVLVPVYKWLRPYSDIMGD